VDVVKTPLVHVDGEWFVNVHKAVPVVEQTPFFACLQEGGKSESISLGKPPLYQQGTGTSALMLWIRTQRLQVSRTRQQPES
jgi:hypothetical protein